MLIATMRFTTALLVAQPSMFPGRACAWHGVGYRPDVSCVRKHLPGVGPSSPWNVSDAQIPIDHARAMRREARRHHTPPVRICMQQLAYCRGAGPNSELMNGCAHADIERFSSTAT